MMNPKKTDTAKREEVVLHFWNKNRIFEKTLEKPAPSGDFIFYDGPPFATGLPHYGHIVASVIKDAIPRYFTMRGYHVPRIWGWDCHGLPIENIVEKELGFKHKRDIKEFGVAKFNELCRERVLSYAQEWEKIIPRIGRFVDMKNAYRTMDKSFMESVWWVFKEIYDKGLVYEDYRSMHICPRCETTLAQTEVAEGYKDVKDIAVTVKFESVDEPGTYFLAWTTTPWTLPGNVALAVGNDIEYGLYEKDGENIIVGAQQAITLGLGAPSRLFHGSELVGKKYKPLFDYYYKDQDLKNRENGWKVYAADFITEDSGTAIAHEAPAFGAEDWELLKQENLPFVQHVNFDGTMKEEVVDFAGMEVRPKSDDSKTRLGTDIAILKYLQEHNLFFSKENIMHAYPHCWRCDTPLLNYATSSWFISVVKLKENLLDNAKEINWSPAHIKEGRFGKWLENARDWSISRQRFWASVIPIWICNTCKEKRVFGSAGELETASGMVVSDLHKHIVDEIKVPCSCGGIMQRVPDVLDTWFDSGSMPYASRHYPFENKDEFDAVFPAQFIAEGTDQTRAWFYYLHVLSGGLFGKPAFKNVIVNGIVLAEDGKKMSKRLQNYPDPMDMVEKYGADALRLYLLSSTVVQAEDLAFSESGVEEVAKKSIGRLRNVLTFYELYKNKTLPHANSVHPLDRWILARINELMKGVTGAYERYELHAATRPLGLLIDDLSAWYTRRSRDRFKDDGEDKAAALATLRYTLHTLAILMAPAAPFIAEEIYQNVKTVDDPESVHLSMWPLDSVWDKSEKKDVLLITEMSRVRSLASEVLMLRQKAGIVVRQPLAQLFIPGEISNELISILAEEVNVKNVVQNSDKLALDTELTPELVAEGDERALMRAVAEARKQEGFSTKDRIRVEKSIDGVHTAEISTGNIRFSLIKDEI
ncbi:MAG: Isoleucyl-tRNA synthetase, isoleucyl-tRNA synthetase [Parcubacteria group bacterium]|nr:Isoleucyl-tRNA synthetase, isoleucyl-tRNA synthetase [Parcubacteria group bacterium]